MKKFIAVILAGMGALVSHAQIINYTVDNYTEQLSPVKVSLTALALDGLSPQFGLTVEGAIGKRLGYNVAYRHDYYKYMFINKDNIRNDNKVRAGNYFEGGIDFFLTSKVKENKAKVRVETESTGYSTKYFNATVDKRKQFGVHGGLIMYNKSFAINPDSDNNNYFITEGDVHVAPTEGMYVTNCSYVSGYAGLVFKKVRKAAVHAGGWIYYRHFGRRFYMDALIGGGKLADVMVGGAQIPVKARMNSPIGYRLGFEWDQMGVVTGFEIGLRPGPNMGPFTFYNYFNLNFSYNLWGGDKRYAMRKKK